MKLIVKDKIEIYTGRTEGASIYSLSKSFEIDVSGIEYLVRLVDTHGMDIAQKNKKYSKHLKEECINRVLIGGETAMDISIEMGLPNKGMLFNWIRNYREMGIMFWKRSEDDDLDDL